MKLVKMSLVAALLAGTSAFAIENTKFSGDANIFYHTDDSGSTSLFHKDAAAADASFNLNVTTDLDENLKAGAGYTVISTLGLENNFVSGVWGGSHSVTTGTGAEYPGAFGGAKVENASWMNEAWIAASLGKSTVKLGRMELDTPLAFTETWSIEKNTFEAAVLVNQDIPGTTIVAAYVGNGNGNETFGQDVNGTVSALGLGAGAIVNEDGQFTTFGTNGAYAFGAINNSYEPLTVQAWYYDVSKLAEAFWVQADLAMDGISAGVQYTSVDVDGATDANTAMALMVGYEMKDTVTAKFAYSSTGDKGGLSNAGVNTATASGASKLYTEMWWTYGAVTAKDTTAMSLTVESPVNGMFDLGVYAVMADAAAANSDLTEITVTAGKEFGPLAATLAYIMDSPEVGDSVNTVQAFLTLGF